MNREFNDLNKQTYSHQEGQQNNIAGSDGSSNSNAEGSNEQTSGLRREAGVAQGGQQSQTESDRANENEDESVRGGNSSI